MQIYRFYNNGAVSNIETNDLPEVNKKDLSIIVQLYTSFTTQMHDVNSTHLTTHRNYKITRPTSNINRIHLDRTNSYCSTCKQTYNLANETIAHGTKMRQENKNAKHPRLQLVDENHQTQGAVFTPRRIPRNENRKLDLMHTCTFAEFLL